MRSPFGKPMMWLSKPFFLLSLSMTVYALPASHVIKIPYHRQKTDYSCGAASMEMVLNFFGPDVMQEAIVNVMRTTPEEGTLSLDIVRGAQFSMLSSSVGKNFVNYSLTRGYPHRPSGLGAFYYDSDQPWINQLKALIAQDYPVIVLMGFDTNDAEDGHYRVVVGYDDVQSEITMMDPWDRDGYPRVAVWPYSKFLVLWNYTEPFSPRVKTYFGVGIFPWLLQINTKRSESNGNLENFIIAADVTYPCFAPFDCSQYKAHNVLLSLQFPEEAAYSVEIQSDQVINIGNLSAGMTSSTTWNIACNGTCAGKQASVNVKGFVSGALPHSYLTSTEFYPPYSYVDVLGSSVKIVLK